MVEREEKFVRGVGLLRGEFSWWGNDHIFTWYSGDSPLPLNRENPGWGLSVNSLKKENLFKKFSSDNIE